LNKLIYQIPKVEIFWSSSDISRVFYALAAILNLPAILHSKKRPQNILFFLRSKLSNKTKKSALAAFARERGFRYKLALIIEQTCFYLHLDASKSAKTPFFKSGFLERGGKPF
jgi:hypothetical protein